jgi:hypothetical protein
MVDLDIRHYCATLLHPDYRSLKGCTNEERIECYAYVREQLELVEKKHKNNNQTQDNKLLKPEYSSFLDDFKDDGNTYNDEWDDDYDTRSIEYSLPMNQSDELSRYLSMKINMNDYAYDVLNFWKSNTDQLPCLSQVARQVHSIPATSAGVERQFSIAGLTLTSRRASLEPAQLDNVICIRSGVKLGNQI